MGTGSDSGDGEGEAVIRDEAYETGDGRLVIFDPKNPLAWVISDWFGTPPDVDREDEETSD